MFHQEDTHARIEEPKRESGKSDEGKVLQLKGEEAFAFHGYPYLFPNVEINIGYNYCSEKNYFRK